MWLVAGAADSRRPRGRPWPTCGPTGPGSRSPGWAGPRSGSPPRRSTRRCGAAPPGSPTTWSAAISAGPVDVVVDATGSPAAGIRHVLSCCTHGKHVVMVNVEADALAGPLLARRAGEAGVVYSLAYGDQPALICEMVDWARAAGLRGGGRREGHPVPAGLPPLHARDRLGSLRVHARSRWRGATSIPGCSTRSSTAPSRPSRWRRCERHRPHAGARTGSSSLPAAWTTWPACSVRARRAARSTTPARSR